jgi:hypothetical protein
VVSSKSSTGWQLSPVLQIHAENLANQETEEIRRSGRATKGQHTKINESPEAPKEKRGKGGRGKAVKTSKEPTPEEDDEEEEDGEAIIRCVCGYVVEDKDDDRPMVMCDNCSAWEHNECVGISDDPDELPEQYFCEQCKPEDHKELLAAMARGEKPWTERAAQREREEAEKKARKKRGKKGGRLSRANEKADENDESGVQSDAPTPSASAAETGRKRKAPAEPTQEISGGEQVCTFPKVSSLCTYITSGIEQDSQGLDYEGYETTTTSPVDYCFYIRAQRFQRQ